VFEAKQFRFEVSSDSAWTGSNSHVFRLRAGVTMELLHYSRLWSASRTQASDNFVKLPKLQRRSIPARWSGERN